MQISGEVEKTIRAAGVKAKKDHLNDIAFRSDVAAGRQNANKPAPHRRGQAIATVQPVPRQPVYGSVAAVPDGADSDSDESSAPSCMNEGTCSRSSSSFSIFEI